MAKYQVVEKDRGSDWHQVRYNDYALTQFTDYDKALDAAKAYLTEVNFNNSLAKDEKPRSAEYFMVTPDGIYLGELDREPYYVRDRKGNIVKEANYFELDDKSEVAVKTIPGT